MRAEIQTYRRLTNHHESVQFVAGQAGGGGRFPASVLLLLSLCCSIALPLKDTLCNEKLFLRGFSLTLIKPELLCRVIISFSAVHFKIINT